MALEYTYAETERPIKHVILKREELPCIFIKKAGGGVEFNVNGHNYYLTEKMIQEFIEGLQEVNARGVL
jgi:hypothetical protein